jgi:hypothetical protein
MGIVINKFNALLDSDMTSYLNENGVILTYSAVISRALLMNLPSDVNESLDNKMKRWELFKRFSQNAVDDVSVTTEEASLIKARVGAAFGVLVFGQIVDAIEGKK